MAVWRISLCARGDVAGDRDALTTAWYAATPRGTMLGQFLAETGAAIAPALEPAALDRQLRSFEVQFLSTPIEGMFVLDPSTGAFHPFAPPPMSGADPGPPSDTYSGVAATVAPTAESSGVGDGAATHVPATHVPATRGSDAPPSAGRDGHVGHAVTDERSVRLAHGVEIDQAASFLKAKLSVLVFCDKLIVAHLARTIVERSGNEPVILTPPEDPGAGGGAAAALGQAGSPRQKMMAELKRNLAALKKGQTLVIPHLDLLAGSSDDTLSNEAREITDLLYAPAQAGEDEPLLLAFADRTIGLPEVVMARFAVRMGVVGVPKVVQERQNDAPQMLAHGLISESEAERLTPIGFDAVELYKHVSGFNPIRLRQAVRYAIHSIESTPADKEPPRFVEVLRAFKEQASDGFEVPNVSFEQIGGYEDVKRRLVEAIRLLSLRDDDLDPEVAKLRKDLIPRGFIFYGPPGTGKTLFAKAIATQLQGNILVVSGPEITDKYVGESERKLRELFAEARRNAPAVLVFDEFDSIATQRSGRDDGGSRAGNAIVAQILTEMDGFRADVPMLVIGTTNQLNLIDEALLRPSRFTAIEIGLPDEKARTKIAEVHSKHFKINCSGELLRQIARSTANWNGDEIRNLFSEAFTRIHIRGEGAGADGAVDIAALLGRIVGEVGFEKNRRAASRQEASTRSRQQAGRNAGGAQDPGARDPGARTGGAGGSNQPAGGSGMRDPGPRGASGGGGFAEPGPRSAPNGPSGGAPQGG